MAQIAFEGLACFTFRTEIEKSKYGIEFKELLLSSNPNPGYYSKQDFPPNQKNVKDHHLYLLVKNQVICFQDLVLRQIARFNAKFNYDLQISPGHLTFQNKEYQCIRVNTRNVQHIPDLIKELNSIGIQFVEDRKSVPYESIVYYKKYIEFVQIAEGVYKDKDNPNRYFFKTNKSIDFEGFEGRMGQIKNNCNFHLFDSFQSHFFTKHGVIDFVGIYSKHCDENRFDELKKNLSRMFD